MASPIQHDERQLLLRERIERVLGRVRPYIQSDGGDIELLDVSGNHANVRLTGHCVGCPTAHLTLHFGIEMAIKREIPEFEGLVLV
jgi:Fe-S cluster biogenesis protein NfuA